MIRGRLGIALAMTGLLALPATVGADVKTQQKTLVKFEGVLGRMMNLFGGKAAKEGLVNTVAVQGDRKATFGDTTGEIVDLAEEKVYEINFKDKSYKVVTFAEIRRKLQEEARKAEEEARKNEDRDKKEPQKEMQVDFDIKETGAKKAINGYDCRQIIATISVHEKGRKLEQAGGIVMTVDSWLAPRIAGMKELEDFDLRYARKMSDEATLASAQQMMQALAMYPGLKDAMAKFQAEKVNMNGTAIQTIMTMQAVKSPEQMEAGRREEGGSPGGVVGGMLGRFGRKKAEAPKEGAAPADPSRATFMTSTTEVMSVSPSVASTDVAVPAGFRQK